MVLHHKNTSCYWRNSHACFSEIYTDSRVIFTKFSRTASEFSASTLDSNPRSRPYRLIFRSNFWAWARMHVRPAAWLTELEQDPHTGSVAEFVDKVEDRGMVQNTSSVMNKVRYSIIAMCKIITALVILYVAWKLHFYYKHVFLAQIILLNTKLLPLRICHRHASAPSFLVSYHHAADEDDEVSRHTVIKPLEELQSVTVHTLPVAANQGIWLDIVPTCN